MSIVKFKLKAGALQRGFTVQSNLFLHMQLRSWTALRGSVGSGRFTIVAMILSWALTFLYPICLPSLRAGLEKPSSDHDVKARCIPFMFQIIGLFLASCLFSLTCIIIVNMSFENHVSANQQFLVTQARVKRAMTTVVLTFLTSSLLQVRKLFRESDEYRFLYWRFHCVITSQREL